MQAFLRFHRGLFGLPLHLQLWVATLVGVNIVAPLFFLGAIEARVTLAAGLLGLTLMMVLTGRYGFSRIVGLGHIAWIPLIAFLVGSLSEASATTAFGFWLRSVLVLDAISLALDGADAIRFLRGDRAETVPNLEPPIRTVYATPNPGK
jgi:hypothetical protein